MNYVVQMNRSLEVILQSMLREIGLFRHDVVDVGRNLIHECKS